MLALAAALALQPAGHPELVRSADRALTAWNYDSGRSGDVPRWIVTLRWVDGDLPREQVLVDSSPDRLGWVEAIGRFESRNGPVFVLVSEDKVGARRYAAVLSAWKLVSGLATLQPFPGFFANVPGVRFDDDSQVRWEYEREPGDAVFPRPIEARLGTEGIRLVLFPNLARDSARKVAPEKMRRDELGLRMKEGVLLPVTLTPTQRSMLDKPAKTD